MQNFNILANLCSKAEAGLMVITERFLKKSANDIKS